MESHRVLVTGCSGFLGRYVVQHLTLAGHEVVGLCVEPIEDLVSPLGTGAHPTGNDVPDALVFKRAND